MYYELRHYVPAPGKSDALRERFASATLPLFETLGIKVTEFWESADASGELWYVVEWSGEAAMKAAWEAFRANPEWIAIKSRSEADGPICTSIRSIPLRKADFVRNSGAG